MNYRKIILLLWASFLLSVAQAQDNRWVLDGKQPSALEILQTDAQGYWYVTGNFQNFIKIGAQYVEEDKGAYFVMKYEPTTQKVMWVRQFPEPIRKMRISDKALYIAGQFRGSLSFDAVELTTYGGYASYLAKIDLATGNFDWVRPIKAEKDALVSGLNVDRAGNVCMTGNFVGVLSLGERSLRPIKFKNFYVIKFDSEGNMLWATQGTAGHNELTGISIWSITSDNNNNIILSGTLSGAGFLGTTPFVSGKETFAGEGNAFTTDIFLAKLNPAGEVVWARSIANQAEVQSIATDTLGSVYLAGNFRGSESKKHKTGEALFDDFKSLKNSIKTGSRAVETCFVAKYSSLGNLIWVKGAESTGESRGTQIAWNIKENCLYVTGFFYRDLKFGSFGLATPNEEPELFLATFAPNGAPKALQGTQNATDKILKDLHLTSLGELYGVGFFKEKFEINQVKIITDNPNVCGFLVKLN